MVAEKVKWDLKDILSADEFDAFYTDLEEELELYKDWMDHLNPEMEEYAFLRFLHFDDYIDREISRLYAFGSMQTDTDTKDEQATAFKNRALTLYQKADDLLRPIGQWIQGKEVEGLTRLDDNNAARLFAAEPNTEYSHHHMRDAERFTLTMPEEKIITHKSLQVLSPLIDLRSKITSDMTFRFKPKGAKRAKVFTNQSEVTQFVHSSNPDEREESYRALMEAYGKQTDKLFLIYSTVIQDWSFESELRGYPSPISRRNHGNHVPDEAIETLLDVCSANTDIFQRYFRMKANMLGVDKLRRCDIYAPLEKTEEKFTFPEAVELVLKTLGQFNSSFQEKAAMIVNENHIHSHPSRSKRSGAYCMTVSPEITPYVLLNHTGTMKSVFTLAHELGHGIHSLYANHLPKCVQSAPLPFAETASTFSEMILFERLFAEANEDVRKSMLVDRLSDSYATIMRQSFFSKFEMLAHEAVPQGVTSEELSEIYFGTLTEQFGDAVDIDPAFRNEWAYIPHFVRSPFYVYAYSFGELLSTALYSMYKNEGESFIPKMENILAAGGSRNPQEVLQEVGIDMTSKDFWQGSFDILNGWQDDLEKLA